MVTLYSYILRELLKTFGLTLLALTVLFTLGGGLYNIVRFEGITSTDVLRMLPMFVPIVLTITMPISALFASTILYGRLAADNEFTACRAAGINIHRLFLPVILLSILVTLYSVLSANYIIPQLTQQVEYYIRSNVRNIAFGALSSKGYMRLARGGLGQVLLTADSVEAVSDKALIESEFEPSSPTRGYFWITNPRIMEVDPSGALSRFASARGALCQFDTEPEATATIHLTGAAVFEMGRRSIRLDEQKIGPSKIPMPMPVKPSMVDLNRLLVWRREPWEAPDLKKQIAGYLTALSHLTFFQYASDALRDGKPLQLVDTLGGTYDIRAGAIGAIDAGRAPILRDVQITYKTPDMTIRYDAPQAILGARAPQEGMPQTLLEFKLEEHGGRRVVETHVRSGHPDDVREKRDVYVDRLLMPEAITARVASISPADVLAAEPTAAMDAALENQRAGLQRTAKTLAMKVDSTIHFRLGYGASPIFTVIIGATLGLMFRGARALAAFGLAAVPFFSSLIVMLMGRQLMENTGTAMVGIYIIWGSLLAFGLAAFILIRVGVRR